MNDYNEQMDIAKKVMKEDKEILSKMSDSNNSKTVQVLREEYYFLDVYITKLERENQNLAKRHIELENSLIELRKYHKEFEQFAATVYDPKKSTYKELETKVAQAEELRKKDIDELWETRITPLQNKVKDQHIQLESVYKRETRLTEEISHLKKVIENLGMLINYAVGYISACEQFRDKHPNDVKNWLFEGLK